MKVPSPPSPTHFTLPPPSIPLPTFPLPLNVWLRRVTRARQPCAATALLLRSKATCVHDAVPSNPFAPALLSTKAFSSFIYGCVVAGRPRPAAAAKQLVPSRNCRGNDPNPRPCMRSTLPSVSTSLSSSSSSSSSFLSPLSHPHHHRHHLTSPSPPPPSRRTRCAASCLTTWARPSLLSR